MLRIAGRTRATETRSIDGHVRLGHAFLGDHVGLTEENLRHEFREIPTTMTLTFGNKAELAVVWEVGQQGFFYLRHDDVGLHEPRAVREVFPSVGIVPVLSPIDPQEELLTEKHVRANLDGRLASRHFRNQLGLLDREWGEHGTELEAFKAFAKPWLSELQLGDLRRSYGAPRAALDLFYKEIGSKAEKEICWVGDGMQIWVQLLLHLYRLRELDVIVLDEPDVFLHADLQRRLVSLLESLDAQVITATHSAEVLAEVEPKSVIWVSKNRTRAVRVPNDEVLFKLSESLGTQFNLRLARTLRARCVFFVEGKDILLLRAVAKTVGATSFAQEAGLVPVPLEGFDRWEHVEAFKWLSETVLDSSVTTHVVLDRDYRDSGTVSDVEDRLGQVGIVPHVWEAHGFESYLVQPAVVSRLSGAEVDWVRAQVAEIADGFEDDFYSGVTVAMMRRYKSQKIDAGTVAKRAKQEADKRWRVATDRPLICPGKELISELNTRLQSDGFKVVTARSLAGGLTALEVPAEVRDLLMLVSAAADGPPV